MRHRLLTALALVLALAAPAFAQTYTANVQLTIDSTAAGIGFTSTDILAGGGHPQVNSASCVSNSAGGEFRYRTDGTAPTTTVGQPVAAGGAITFTDTTSLLTFRGIRTGGTSAVLNCLLSDAIVPPINPVGGGGGGGAGSVTQGTTPWIVAGGGVYGTAGTVPVNTQVCDSDSCAQVTAGGAVLASGILAANTSAAAANRMPTLPAIVQNSAPSLTDGRDAALSLTTGGAARVMITNSAGTAQTIATDQTFGTSTYTEATTTGPLVGGVRTDTPTALANTTNEVAPLSISSLGGLYVAHVNDPCGRLAQSTFVVDIVTATTTEIANASASNKLYICSVNLIAGGAQNVAIVEDDSDTCASPTAGLNGGVTAGEGWNFAANGGIALPNTGFSHMETSTTNRYVCFITSAAVQLSGTVKYVLAP